MSDRLGNWGGPIFEGLPVLAFWGQIPGVHDHKPYDDCLKDCPGRLLPTMEVWYRGEIEK